MIEDEHLGHHSHGYLSIPITTLVDGAYSFQVLMLYVAFQILIEFVRSNELDKVDWSQGIEMEHARDEIVDLYNWWMSRRPARKSPLDGTVIDADTYHAVIEEDVKLFMAWEREDQDNLIRLVNIRQYF